tara:strand:+ start:254 stop:391 length:138 start_codon:yes stop_codon:yes gene_type:complete
MPFKSKKQRKYLFAKKPKLAREWADKYNKGSKVKKNKTRKTLTKG